MSEDRKKIIAKLIKIKALAERGVGGEQATAQLMYDTLKKRYGITDEEVSRAAGGTVDITEIDLKQCWGLAFALGVIANNLQDEMELCTICPHTHTEDCAGCGTHENIKDLQIQYETMKQKLEEVAMEVQGMARTKILVPPEKQCGYTSVIVSYSTGIDSTGAIYWATQNFAPEKYSCCTATLAQSTA